MAKSKQTRFQKAVEGTPAIREKYRSGVQALEARDRERLDGKEAASGSIFVDEALKKAKSHATANRWDYGIGLRPDGQGQETVLWLEVHHAASKQADKVMAKLAWLKAWLQAEAPLLGAMRREFVWLLSNVETNPNDRERRNLLAEKHGLKRVQGRLNLGVRRVP